MFSHQIHSTSGWNWGVPNVPLKKSSVPFHLQRIPSIHQHFWLEGKGSEYPHRYYRDRWTMTMKSPMKSQCVDCGPPWNRDFSRNVDAQKRLPCLGFMEDHTQKKQVFIGLINQRAQLLGLEMTEETSSVTVWWLSHLPSESHMSSSVGMVIIPNWMEK